MLIKIHKAYRNVVAVCDSDLLGKKFEQGNKQIDLTGDFFKGQEKTEEEIKEILEDMVGEDAIFNIVGENSCKIAEKSGLISKKEIIYIDNVPIALILL